MEFFTNWKFRSFVVCAFALLHFTVNGQSTWTTPESIYSDSYVTIELSYRLSPNSCAQDGKRSKFRYNIIGSLRPYKYFLNWKMDYLDCSGGLYWQEYSINIGTGGDVGNNLESMDYMFTCSSLEVKHYDETASYAASAGSGRKEIPLSKDPESIIGKSNIFRSETTELKVNGGELGAEAKWVWYKNQCGENQIGTGNAVSVTPLESTTYFVRAEGKKNTTKCVELTVEVNQSSSDPSGIAGKTRICKGENTTLIVNGGTLGKGADWVWYISGLESKQIGRGNSISVAPESSTIYAVRGEGDLNKTNFTKVQVSTYDKSVAPLSVTGNAPMCEGEKLVLKVKGGELAKDATWKWYDSFCGTGYVGEGESVQVAPSTNTAYYVRGEGVCNNTNCVSVTVAVMAKSSSPAFISFPSVVNKNEKVGMSVIGGNLGYEGQWVWYKKSGGVEKAIGKGASITIRPKTQTNYLVRAEGLCNKTNFVTATITPQKAHQFAPTYTSNDENDRFNNKFLQIGAGIGIDVTDLSFLTHRISRSITTGKIVTSNYNYSTIIGLGFKGDFVFHPIMKDYFSLGLLASGAVGSNPLVFTGWKQTGAAGGYTTGTEKYFYTRFDVGMEIAAGYSRLKALVIYRSSIQTHDYKKTQTDYANTTETNFNIQIRKEIVSAGIRVAPYSTLGVRYKRGFCFDFMYNLSRDYTWKWENFDWKYNALSGWQSGPGFSLWIQSILKLQFDALFDTKFDASYIPSSTYDNKMYFQISLMYNRNAFY